MIVFDLACRDGGHRFEGWFRSSEDFASQQQRSLLICPHCGSHEIAKAVMAPAVGRKGNQPPAASAQGAENVPATRPARPEPQAAVTLSPEAKRAVLAMAEMQKTILEKSRWVGREFTEQARAMHYGEREAAQIHGEASHEQAEELAEEGIEIAALPFPIAPPDALN